MSDDPVKYSPITAHFYGRALNKYKVSKDQLDRLHSTVDRLTAAAKRKEADERLAKKMGNVKVEADEDADGQQGKEHNKENEDAHVAERKNTEDVNMEVDDNVKIEVPDE